MAHIDSIDRTVVERQDPLVGSVLDSQYLIHERIAAGGFAAIYRATHLPSKHEFAIKILHANLVSDERVLARFRREGAALAALHDKHTITAYELGEAPNGTLYIVMELLRGESLYERFRARGPLTWQATVELARAVCSSLAEAHALGIIHRDLKPANIHLERRGDERDFVKVLDFGIVRVSDNNADIDTSELTQAGQVIGTFDYMSPEQMVGGSCNGRSDIYAVGVLMYEMISGVRPFAEATTLTSLLAAVLTGTPPTLASRIMVPAGLDRIVMRCLEREPQQRYNDVGELAAALERLTARDEPVTRRISLNEIPPEITSSEDVTRIARVRPGSEQRIAERADLRASEPRVDKRASSHQIDARASHPQLDVRAPYPQPDHRGSSQHLDPQRGSRPRVPTPPPPIPERRSAPVVLPPPERISSPAAPLVLATPLPRLPPVQPTVDLDPSLHQPMWNMSPNGPPPMPMPAAAPQAARGSALEMQPYDMAQARSHDLIMRRIVIALSLALVGLLAFVIAAHG